MWDDPWGNGIAYSRDVIDSAWRNIFDNDAPESEPLELAEDEQARKLKVARFAHVPPDCLEIKTEAKEAE